MHIGLIFENDIDSQYLRGELGVKGEWKEKNEGQRKFRRIWNLGNGELFDLPNNEGTHTTDDLQKYESCRNSPLFFFFPAKPCKAELFVS
ncbi:hypothetical protein CH375_01090 [Leptospira ellisii]|uniref:Uncharacterized protein n=1 Tax=Leptospira ellisii TaxID=2023197 RepID=A0A2N0B7Z5_9LEPT|nr:hypothetical protein CH379_12125 [Leptospira ellisii]PKA06168.1 hypothetical protein CH375_01090 [Leptospira ellisii]